MARQPARERQQLGAPAASQPCTAATTSCPPPRHSGLTGQLLDPNSAWSLDPTAPARLPEALCAAGNVVQIHI